MFHATVCIFTGLEDLRHSAGNLAQFFFLFSFTIRQKKVEVVIVFFPPIGHGITEIKF